MSERKSHPVEKFDFKINCVVGVAVGAVCLSSDDVTESYCRCTEDSEPIVPKLALQIERPFRWREKAKKCLLSTLAVEFD